MAIICHLPRLHALPLVDQVPFVPPFSPLGQISRVFWVLGAHWGHVHPATPDDDLDKTQRGTGTLILKRSIKFIKNSA